MTARRQTDRNALHTFGYYEILAKKHYRKQASAPPFVPKEAGNNVEAIDEPVYRVGGVDYPSSYLQLLLQVELIGIHFYLILE